MKKQAENISTEIKNHMAVLLPVSIDDLNDISFADIENTINTVAANHFNGKSEALWQAFWHQHASAAALPENSNYQDAVQQFYTFWQTLKHNTTQGTRNDITLAIIITAQRGYERLVPFLATQMPLSELINTRDGAGNPLAHIAIMHSRSAYVEALQRLINMFLRGTMLPTDNNGVTALHCAILDRQTETAEFIWQHRLSEHTAICQYGSALHMAITQHNEPLIILFGKKLAHILTPSGQSPLHIAVTARNIFAINHLLSEKLCSIHITNTQNDSTVLDDAIDNACARSVVPIEQSLEVITCLLAYGADLNRSSKRGSSPFETMIARAINDPESVRIQKTLQCIMRQEQLISPSLCRTVLTTFSNRLSSIAHEFPELRKQLTAIAARPETPSAELHS